MGDPSAEHVIVGFDFSGDPMLRGERLTFEEGLTVLYGLNGTGKSRLIRGIRGALLGVQTDVNVSLLARAVVTQEAGLFIPAPWRRQRDDARPFALALAQELADPSDYRAAPGQRSSEREFSPETVEAVVIRHIEAMVGWEYPELRAEVLDDRLFVLAPTGTEGAPSWDAYAVADRSRPAAEAVLQQLRQVEETYPDDDTDDDEFDAYVEKLRAIPFFATGGDVFIARGHRRVRVQPSSVELYNITMTDLLYESPVNLEGPIDFGVDVLTLEHDAVDATHDHFARLVAGALNDKLGFDGDEDSFDGTFSFGNPEYIRNLWHRLADERRKNAIEFIEQAIDAAAEQLSERVTTALQDVLLDALVARLEVAPSALRASMPALEWRFHRASTARVQVGLDGLSKAERLWAERSINEAVYWHRREHDASKLLSLRPAVYLLDEPESALHRAAEAFMARSLLARAKDAPRALIVATHSPELLDTTEARLVELRHDGGDNRTPTVRRLDFADRQALDALGLTPSDLLRWPRVLLLVEGMHDEVLLDHYFADRLRAARVDVLVLRGGTKLHPTVDSKVLFDHTEAHVVALMDNENAETLTATWAKAQVAAAQGNKQAAIDTVLHGIPLTSSESGFLREWLQAALKRDLDSRITPYALEAADIIDYLPVTAFVPQAESWAELHAQHQAERESAPTKTVKRFKPWLQQKFQFRFTEETLRAAAEGTTAPAEFERFMKTLESISAARG
ncbi:hypothetical protein [Microbacterium sp. YJN-G]|uniref:hypothetical protein n=1 Tax=Microbacterium sp. YJN-G TaxID=2763257 RepID=UPI00187807D9|nr:hypothetical protein [Microbacterium sp. YJN-G]